MVRGRGEAHVSIISATGSVNRMLHDMIGGRMAASTGPQLYESVVFQEDKEDDFRAVIERIDQLSREWISYAANQIFGLKV